MKQEKVEFTGKFNWMGGDVEGFSIYELPKDVQKMDNHPIAYGETSGHVHVITGDVQLFQDGEGKVYAAVGSDGAFHQHLHESQLKPEIYKVNKNISTADHTKECRIEPGNYLIGIHQKYEPFKKIFEKVID